MGGGFHHHVRRLSFEAVHVADASSRVRQCLIQAHVRLIRASGIGGLQAWGSVQLLATCF